MICSGGVFCIFSSRAKSGNPCTLLLVDNIQPVAQGEYYILDPLVGCDRLVEGEYALSLSVL